MSAFTNFVAVGKSVWSDGNHITTRVAISSWVKNTVVIFCWDGVLIWTHHQHWPCPFSWTIFKSGCDGLNLTREVCPIVHAAAIDGIAPHLIYIIQQLIAMTRGIIQHGIVQRHRVINRLSENHFCGGTGKGVSLFGTKRLGTSGISIGVGLPVISVSNLTGLWKYVVVRSPPLYHVEKQNHPTVYSQALSSWLSRLIMEAPTPSRPVMTKGSKHDWMDRDRAASQYRTKYPVWWWLYIICGSHSTKKLATHVLRFFHVEHEEIAVVIMPNVFW